MSHDLSSQEWVAEEAAHFDSSVKLIRMANQIGTFFTSKPHEEGVAGTAEHINKFWEPRMRRQFFKIVDAGGEGLLPIVIEAARSIRRPAEQPSNTANAGAPGGKGSAAGESKAEIAATQG